MWLLNIRRICKKCEKIIKFISVIIIVVKTSLYTLCIVCKECFELERSFEFERSSTSKYARRYCILRSCSIGCWAEMPGRAARRDIPPAQPRMRELYQRQKGLAGANLIEWGYGAQANHSAGSQLTWSLPLATNALTALPSHIVLTHLSDWSFLNTLLLFV